MGGCRSCYSGKSPLVITLLSYLPQIQREMMLMRANKTRRMSMIGEEEDNDEKTDKDEDLEKKRRKNRKDKKTAGKTAANKKKKKPKKKTSGAREDSEQSDNEEVCQMGQAVWKIFSGDQAKD